MTVTESDKYPAPRLTSRPEGGMRALAEALTQDSQALRVLHAEAEPERLPIATIALQDWRERNQHQDAERKSSLLASIVESALDAIIGATPDGSIVIWNPAAERMFGYSAEEVYGKSLNSLFPAPNAGNLPQHYETQGLSKAGAPMNLAVTLSPIWSADGLTGGHSAIVRDITEQKRQQSQLVTTQKLDAIGQLASGVAHDFNNLLTPINGYARMLLRKGSFDLAKMEAILQAAERGQRLTKQLSMLSRKQAPQFEPVNLNSLLLSSLDMLRPIIGDGIELRTALEPDLPAVFADAGQLEHVITNLVMNARDAMPQGGRIVLATASKSAAQAGTEKGTVWVSVIDTGVGMPPEVKTRIFEPFFTTKEAGHGNGLGLSTSRDIVEHLKGKLLVESTPGQGSTFSICLPSHGKLQAVSPPVPAAAESVVSGSGTVLLAEDDATVSAFTTALLRKGGYTVIAAENGTKALELCRTFENPLYALVTDVSMPGMSGSTLAEQARLLRPDLKVLFVSGDIDHCPKEEELARGLTAFLEKPFGGEALLKVMSRFSAKLPALP